MAERKTHQIKQKKFDSIEAFHKEGFVLESERASLVVSQAWKEEMKAQGISVGEMAFLTNSTRSAIYKYLGDEKTEPSLATAILICEALGISFEKGFCLMGSDKLYSLYKQRKNHAKIARPTYLDVRTLCVLQEVEWQQQEDKDMWFKDNSTELFPVGTAAAKPCYEKIYCAIPRRGGGASAE